MTKFAALFLNLLFVASWIGPIQAQQRSCDTIPLDPCLRSIDRDVIFLLDASDSISESSFVTQMIDYVQTLFCVFDYNDPEVETRLGIITFNTPAIVRVPLARYTEKEWFDATDEMRDPAMSICCQCCTDHAAAFKKAREVLEQNGKPGRDTTVLMITDGQPFQSTSGPYAYPGMSPAEYAFKVVPQQANLLKNTNGFARVLLVGIPNEAGSPPRSEYFYGIPTQEFREPGKPIEYQCVGRNGTQHCAKMESPPFPIVSNITNAIFISKNTKVPRLVENTRDLLCDVPAPTASPTTTPTASPTPVELDSLDMYIYLDRSNSMTWVPDLCMKELPNPEGVPEEKACWTLFLAFIERAVVTARKIQHKGNEIGWYDQHGRTDRGLRVFIVAFACTGKQSVPVAITIGEAISNEQDFQKALQFAGTLTPEGGTCPGAAIERSVAWLWKYQPLERKFKTALLMTDGRFYDMPEPANAIKGLRHFNVVRYALPVSLTFGQLPDFWLSKAEQKIQRDQLNMYVDGKKERILNLGAFGLQVLQQLAEDWIQQIKDEVAGDLFSLTGGPVEPDAWYCPGFISPPRCENMEENSVATGKYCKWSEKHQKCVHKDFCNYPKGWCLLDDNCRWNFRGNRCTSKDGVMPADAYSLEMFFEARRPLLATLGDDLSLSGQRASLAKRRRRSRRRSRRRGLEQVLADS